MSDENFDRIAEHYDHSLPAHVVAHYLAKRVRFIREHCQRGAALDVGCGTGTLAARLADEDFQMTGIDPSKGMLEVMAENHPEVTAVQGSGDSLPFDFASFDFVYSVAAFHHIADPEAVRKTLAEMVRVTRPGGKIIIWDHNGRNPYWRILMAKVPQDDGSERLIPEAELRAGLSAAGCTEISVFKLGFVPDLVSPRMMRIARRVEKMVEHTPLLRRLSAHNVVVAVRP